MPHDELRAPHRFQQLVQPLFDFSRESNGGVPLRLKAGMELVHFLHRHLYQIRQLFLPRLRSPSILPFESLQFLLLAIFRHLQC